MMRSTVWPDRPSWRWTDDLPDLASVIQRVTDNSLELAITHGHVDHIGAICESDHVDVHPWDKQTIMDIRSVSTFDFAGASSR
jgi:hypothetical protein